MTDFLKIPGMDPNEPSVIDLLIHPIEITEEERRKSLRVLDAMRELHYSLNAVGPGVDFYDNREGRLDVRRADDGRLLRATFTLFK